MNKINISLQCPLEPVTEKNVTTTSMSYFTSERPLKDNEHISFFLQTEAMTERYARHDKCLPRLHIKGRLGGGVLPFAQNGAHKGAKLTYSFVHLAWGEPTACPPDVSPTAISFSQHEPWSEMLGVVVW